MSNNLTPPHLLFTDIDGSPLDAGFVFIGEDQKDPIQFPTEVFWDEALTEPATQPIRTRNGFISQDGVKAFIYTAANKFSVSVKDRNEDLVYQKLSFEQFIKENAVQALIDAALVPINESINDEVDRATEAEAVLNNSILAEKNRAIAAESVLDGKINANGVGNRAYKTYAEMDADKANIPPKSKVTVTNDPTVANNGDWQWDGVVFTKSTYDPLTQANNYTNAYVAQKLPVVKALYLPANNVDNVYVHLPDGVIASSAGTALNVFPVKDGKTYVVKSTKASSSTFAIALRATNSPAVGPTLGLVTLNATDDPNVKTFTIPAGSTARYAFVNIKVPSLNFDISSDFLVNEGAKPVEYDQIYTIDGVTIVDEHARARMLEKSSLITITELYDPLSNVADKYVAVPSGSVFSSPGTMLSIFPVEAGKSYAIRSGGVNNSALAVALRATNTTANGTTLGLVTLNPSSDPKVKTFMVPAGSAARFALINIKVPSVGLNIEADLSVTMTFPSGSLEVSGINQMPLADTYARDQIARIESDIITGNSKLTGKSWAAIGDSITEHNFRSNLNYHDYVKEEVGGMTVYNLGISGSGFWNRANSIAGSITQNPDYLTVFWGANDLIRAPKNLGNRDSTGTDSVGGLMNIALSALINKFYNKKLAVFTLLPRDIYNNVTNAIAVDESGVSQGYTATQIADLTIAVCEKYSIPVLDLYRESNLYPWIAAANDYYFKAPSLPTPDGLHPNDNGQKLIAHKIREFMESL
ncbi:SGNH/GDSL hydrolase family protein [Acinetobacter sp. 'aerobic (ED)']|uniref:SGNH/GDSL hydrolase family protein n=1 Tax=Acinetobacter sp. 'aerobic (ED)' TaxID=174230 RepID=UPI00192C5089|nr:SGNH/GDSL hydrolase family protein [Acinetobacter sp. 'aerobic (ED)']